MANFNAVNIFLCFLVGLSGPARCYKLPKNDEKCPEVKARSNCDFDAVSIIYFTTH